MFITVFGLCQTFESRKNTTPFRLLSFWLITKTMHRTENFIIARVNAQKISLRTIYLKLPDRPLLSSRRKSKLCTNANPKTVTLHKKHRT